MATTAARYLAAVETTTLLAMFEAYRTIDQHGVMRPVPQLLEWH